MQRLSVFNVRPAAWCQCPLLRFGHGCVPSRSVLHYKRALATGLRRRPLRMGDCGCHSACTPGAQWGIPRLRRHGPPAAGARPGPPTRPPIMRELEVMVLSAPGRGPPGPAAPGGPRGRGPGGPEARPRPRGGEPQVAGRKCRSPSGGSWTLPATQAANLTEPCLCS